MVFEILIVAIIATLYSLIFMGLDGVFDKEGLIRDSISLKNAYFTFLKDQTDENVAAFFKVEKSLLKKQIKIFAPSFVLGVAFIYLILPMIVGPGYTMMFIVASLISSIGIFLIKRFISKKRLQK